MSNIKDEYLFWLVFRNKFILNKIINYIQTIEWVIYDDHSQLHINNRLKLDDTHSLGLMIDNKLYPLLNYKLDNNHTIDIDKQSITALFNQLSINNNNHDEIIMIKEIIIKLLSTRRDEFEITDLTLIAVECNSIEVLRILINEAYSIPIYPSTLKYAIEHCHPSIVELILNSNNSNNLSSYRDVEEEEDDKIKSKYLESASANQEYSLEMIDCIIKLNHNNIIQQQQQQQPFKKLKISTSSSSSSISNNNRLSNEVYYRFNSLIKDIKISEIIKLSHEKVVSIYQTLYMDDDESVATTTTRSMKQFETLIILKLKQDERLVESFNDFYQTFIIKYDEIIDECHIYEEEDDDHTDDTEIDKQQQILKFKLFSSIFDIKNNFKNIIKECKNGELVWNKLILEIINVINFNDDNEDTLVPVIINDRSTIDWMLNCENESILSFIRDNFQVITFSTLELADYVYKESGLIEHLTNENGIDENIEFIRSTYSHVWKEAIRQSDYNTLKYIDSLTTNISGQTTNYQHIINYVPFHATQSTPLSLNQFTQMIDYINGFNRFRNGGDYFDFFQDLENVFLIQDGGGKEMISNLHLRFDQLDYFFFEFLRLAVGQLRLNWFEILLLNSNIFDKKISVKSTPECANQFKDLIEFGNIINGNGKIEYFNLEKRFISKNIKIYNTHNVKIEIIEILKKIIKKFKSRKDPQHYEDEYDLLSIILNFFFKILISIKGITMEEVKEVYELIQDHHHSLVHHTVYHSFWYLHIKNIYLSFYILNPAFINHLFKGRKNYAVYNCLNFREGYVWIHLQDYLNSSDFTFESINSLSFNNLLEMLDNQLSPLSLVNHQNYYLKNNKFEIENYLSFNLEYYLIIKRFDLFFNKLNQIKSKSNLFSKSIISFNSPSTTLLPNSILFNNNKHHDDQNELELEHTFKFSKNLLNSICKILNLDQVVKIIKFNFNQTEFQDELLLQAVNCHRIDIMKLIIDNFKIPFQTPFSNINLKSSSSSLIQYLNYWKITTPLPCSNIESSSSSSSSLSSSSSFKLFKFIFLHLLENHFKLKKNINQFNQFKSTSTSTEIKMNILKESFQSIKKVFEKLYNDENKRNNKIIEIITTTQSSSSIELFKQDEYQQLFKKVFNQQNQSNDHHACISSGIGSCNYYNNQEDNIFLLAFRNGNIKLCESILSKYNSKYQFNLTKKSITKAIKNNNIHIINHFKKNHSNMLNNDDLIDHLNNELNNHYDYIYLNKNKIK